MEQDRLELLALEKYIQNHDPEHSNVILKLWKEKGGETSESLLNFYCSLTNEDPNSLRREILSDFDRKNETLLDGDVEGSDTLTDYSLKDIDEVPTVLSEEGGETELHEKHETLLEVGDSKPADSGIIELEDSGTIMHLQGSSSGGEDETSTVISGEEKDLADKINTVMQETPQQRLPEKTSVRVKEHKYKIIGEIARGGMGAIIKILNPELKRFEVIKVITASEVDEDHIERTYREYGINGLLSDHPNIPVIHDIDVDENGRPRPRMELIRGQDMHKIISKREAGLRQEFDGEKKEEGLEYLQKFPIRRMIRHFLEACRGLAFAHKKGIIHRDVKPAQIMIDEEYNNALLCDWGLAKEKGSKEEDRGLADKDLLERLNEAKGGKVDPKLSFDGMMMGTPSYMSPEQADGDLANVDESSDIFSMGAVLYEMLTGEPPYTGATIINVVRKATDLDTPITKPSEKRSQVKLDIRADKSERQVNKELEAICMKALAKKKEGRYQSMDEMVADVEAFFEGRPVSSYKYNLVQRGLKWLKRHPVIRWSITAGLAVGIIGGGIAGYFIYQAKVGENKALEAKVRRSEADALVEEGALFAERNNLEKALEFYLSAREKDPTYPLVFNNLGHIFYSTEKFEEAILNLEEAIQKDEIDSTYDLKGSAHLTLADCYFALGRKNKEKRREFFQKALAYFDEAIRINPDKPSSYNRRAVLFMNMGRYDDALQDFNSFIERAPNDAIGYRGRGYILLMNGKLDEAEADFLKAKEHDYLESLYYLGVIEFRRANWQKARSYLSTSLDVNKGFNVGNIEKMLGEIKERLDQH